MAEVSEARMVQSRRCHRHRRNPACACTKVPLFQTDNYSVPISDGRTLTKTYDADYAIDSIQANPTGLTLDATTDVMGNVIALSQTLSRATPDRSYQYDPLYRLSKANAGATTRESYTYSPTGDRTSATVNGATQAYTYTAGTHHLASVGATVRSYDANGNTTSNNLAYDQRNRLAGWKLQGGQISLGGDSAQYGYNGKGERTVKQVTYNDHCLAPACYPGPGAPTGWLTGTAAFAYDEAGHLIGEYPSLYGPGRNTEYVNLDSTPIAAIRSSQLHEIETDHLGTPRAIVKPGTTPSTNVTVWRWDLLGNTFGADAPNEDPDGDGTAFTFNLRYPGQYRDAETGLSYNRSRDFDASIGRYVESDPIGVNGGVNTYSYVNQNPLVAIDPSGLIRWSGEMYVGGGSGVIGATFALFDLKSECVNGKYAYTHAWASAVVFGTGIKFSASGGPVTFDDGYTAIDPYVFQGRFVLWSAAGGPGLNPSWSYIQLGDAFSIPSWTPSPSIGLDFSAFATIYGRSMVFWPEIKDCKCNG
ncbi:MAG: RHS repeat-associated core domain-containing protein [Anaerolineae bacterium]|nr:RHS repeat-associated core domain-containing protein [Anaerolineae bacterium]